MRRFFSKTTTAMTTDTREQIIKEMKAIETSFRKIKNLMLNTSDKDELETIMSDICTALQLKEEEVKSNKRPRHLVDARAIFAYRARVLGYGYVSIGKAMNRDHSTAMNMIRRYEAYASYDEEFKDKIFKVRMFKNDNI